jgi:nucleoside-diphosphate-sugar epimerase
VLSSGRRRCDWIYVTDVAEALLHAAVHKVTDEPGLDIGTGKLISIRRVAEVIRGHVGTPLDPVFSDELDRPNEQERAAEVERTYRLTGWRAQVSLTEGIARTVAWHRRVRAEDPRTPMAPQGSQRSSRLRPSL